MEVEMGLGKDRQNRGIPHCPLFRSNVARHHKPSGRLSRITAYRGPVMANGGGPRASPGFQ